ncbi:MAG TPA: type VI secretion system membrane subunit TssM [Hyphomicrobiales bacterium]|nr:type VI secretion system membrane subunit TssM [Hyphomicrobiales bacterium]
MNRKDWLRYAFVALGIVALCVVVWIAGPLVGIGESHPLEGFGIRLAIVLAILLVAAALIGWSVWKKRKAAAALEKGIAEAGPEESDVAGLQAAMKDALATLRSAKGASRDALYDLPWYVIIGPPGAGKTTALVNSGLKFPVHGDGQPQPVAGVGGTRYCDWWFTEEAVLIDTAGRYTTQDSDAKVDRAGWLAFLDLLKKNRPRQPINGVLVAISVEDLMTLRPDELAAHSAAIRRRLLELHERLKVDFPVYALFTKADLVAGFMEFFGHLNEADRSRVWGHTFQTADKTKNLVGQVPAEFDALIERLNEQLPDKLQDEPTPSARVALFGFPSQMAAVKPKAVAFLNEVFEPTRYHADATLRGFYFTSGTQHGTPIDQLLGAMARAYGTETVGAEAFSGIGKSFFLTNLLRQVVIGEAGWVSNDSGAVRRSRLIAAGTYAAIGLVAIVALALWAIGYSRNSALISATQAAVADYTTTAAPLLSQTTVSDHDFAKVLPALIKLRDLPAGYAVRDQKTPLLASLGLSVRERLQSASERAYHIGLERLFRTRLIYRMEELLEARHDDPSFLYEALKVYLMLGDRAPQLDKDQVIAWMQRDWAANLYPGAANDRGRTLLEQHLRDMLDLDPGTEPVVALNGPLVEQSQRTLARLSVAERAYQLLKTEAAPFTARDWVASTAGGPDADLVFQAVGGQDLATVRVPFFFTYDGFQQAFVDKLGDIAKRIDQDRWVLGDAGQQQAVAAQYGTLPLDLMRLYGRDFVAAWHDALAKLRLRSLVADKPKYVALAAAAAPTSPLKQILQSIRDQTELTREPPKAKGDAPGASGAGGGGAAAKEAKRLGGLIARQQAGRLLSAVPGGIGSTLSSAQIPPLGGSASAAGGAAAATAPARAPGSEIESQFKAFQILVEGGNPPVDTLLRSLSDIAQNLAVANTDRNQAAAANNALVTDVATLRATAPRFPAPFEGMIRNAANDFEKDATGANMEQLAQKLAEVTRVCKEVVQNRYPFSRNAEREVPMVDFGRMFGPNGILDQFFKQNLDALVDKSKSPWTGRLDNRLARSLSPETLRAFQNAADIRDAFFPTGGVVPSVGMTVTPLTAITDSTVVTLDINSVPVKSQRGVNTPVTMQWPGSGVGKTSLTLSSGGGFFASATPIANFERPGTWSLFRLLDLGSVLDRGDSVIANFVLAGHQLSYQFNVNSTKNPLVSPALRQFRCPEGL